MTFDWFHLLFAILLLWLPRQVLRTGLQLFRRSHRSRRSFKDTNPARMREPGDPSVGFRTEFGKSRNYIDFLRAGLASVALIGGMPGIDAAITASAEADPATARLVLGLQLLILLIGVLIQAFRFEARVTLFPPIFYLTGLSLGLCGPTVALFAFLLVWTINMALPNPTMFLFIYSLLLAGFTALFRGLQSPVPYVMSALCFLPAFISLLIRRPLVLFSKKTKPAGTSPAS